MGDREARIERLTAEAHKAIADAIVEKTSGEVTELLTNSDKLPGYLLQFHLWIEYNLEKLILYLVKRGDRILDSARLTFHQKLTLVHALDVLDDATIVAIGRVNSLRNRCSHVRAIVLSAEEFEKIGRSYGRRYKESVGHLEKKGLPAPFAIGAFALIAGRLAAQVALVDGTVELHCKAAMAKEKPEGADTGD